MYYGFLRQSWLIALGNPKLGFNSISILHPLQSDGTSFRITILLKWVRIWEKSKAFLSNSTPYQGVVKTKWFSVVMFFRMNIFSFIMLLSY